VERSRTASHGHQQSPNAQALFLTNNDSSTHVMHLHGVAACPYGLSREESLQKGQQKPSYLQKQLIGDARIVHLAGQSQLVGGAQVFVGGSQGLVYGQPGGSCQAVQL